MPVPQTPLPLGCRCHSSAQLFAVPAECCVLSTCADPYVPVQWTDFKILIQILNLSLYVKRTKVSMVAHQHSYLSL